MGLHKIWIEQCEAAGSIEDEFGTQQALKSLVGEKLPNYLEAADGVGYSDLGVNRHRMEWTS